MSHEGTFSEQQQEEDGRKCLQRLQREPRVRPQARGTPFKRMGFK